MTTVKCPICNQTLSGYVCPHCGYDTSRDYESYPSLGRIPARLPSVAARRALCDRKKQNPRKNRRPVLWFALAALLIVLAISFGYRTLTIGAHRLSPSPVEDFLYSDSGGGVTITGYKGDGGDVVVPSDINGKPVTSIGDNAFYGCGSLTSIRIPDSVTSIGEYAFFGCDSLTSVSIPNNVTSIGDRAFIWCNSLTSVSIPDSVTSIPHFAFCGCSSLTSVSIPDRVTSIGDFAFEGCSSLTSVSIPDSVTSIGGFAFSGCSSLTSVSIPNSVTSIGDLAFEGCSSLASVSIPNSVTSIGVFAFSDCISLTSVSIPNSVTSIGAGAFLGCNNLKNVYYSGTKAQWQTISIGVYNGVLTSATIHYNSK